MSAPNVYHVMEWSIHNENFHGVKKCVDQTICKVSYVSCIRNTFPTTTTVKFQETTSGGDLDILADSQRIIVQIDNNKITEEEYVATQIIGKGDSGTGHWIENQYWKRSVLVGITTSSYKAATSYIQKTNHPEILGFIKDNIF